MLWWPALHYPIVSDTALYALLGESLWDTGTYAVLGELHGKHLPLHPILSYPLVAAFGYHVGMKVSTLIAGALVLVALFMLLDRFFHRSVAVGGVLALLFHHGFVMITTLGSADLLLALLFLLSLLVYERARKRPRLYIYAGVLAGLACLTRYNGIVLFPLFLLFTAWKRKDHLRSGWFWGGLLLGAGLLSLWFIRDALVFGDPLRNEYTGELQQRFLGIFRQPLVSIRYYLQPMSNVLPVLFLLGLVGVWRRRTSHVFLVLAMAFAGALLLVWPVLNLRYALPVYTLFIGFAVAEALEILDRLPRFRVGAIIIFLSAIIASDGAALCIYTYGACNAWVDRTVGIFPLHLGLTSEGLYTWDLARDALHAMAEKRSEVVVAGPVNASVMREGVFREDLQIVEDHPRSCPSYAITQDPPPEARIMFRTTDAPVTAVVRFSCVQ